MLKIFSIILISIIPAFSESEPPTHIFSGYYNIARTSFEARYKPKDWLYFGFVPSIIAEGQVRKANSDALFPNLHMEQAYSVYGYLKLFRINQYAETATRAGLEVQNISSLSEFFYFSEFGLRLKINPIENWVFDLSSFPIQYSFQTHRDISNITIFVYSSLNFGIEYLF